MKKSDHLTPTELRELFASSGVAIRKRWGQNFLIDPNLIEKIGRLILSGCDGSILEIGPGPGTLTSLLLAAGRTVHAIEIDPFLCTYLRERFERYPTFHLHESDARKLLATINGDGEEAIRAGCLCGNLPYNITTDLLTAACRIPSVTRGFFLVQKEYAVRVTRSIAESSITVFLQNFGTWKIALHLPPDVFYPRPKVHSSLLEFVPHAMKADPAVLEKILRMSFRGKRKKIVNSWSSGDPLLPVERLIEASGAIGLDTTKRADELAIQTYYDLARRFTETP